MARNRSVEASEVLLSSELTSAGALLLDKSTKLRHLGKTKGFAVSTYPSCSEGSIWPIQRLRDASGYVDFEAPFARSMSPGKWKFSPESVPEDSRGRQAKTAVRRICRHNELGDLVTLTFGGFVPELSAIPEIMELFFRRLNRATRRSLSGPLLDRSRENGARSLRYVYVLEWGKETGRLHVHIGCNFWAALNCVEVCAVCDEYGVIEKYPSSHELPENYLCIGCVWGRGFVGKPKQNADGKGLSKYLGKYIAKDLAGGEAKFSHATGQEIERLPFGAQRYRASNGSKPLPVRLWAPDEEVARAAVLEVAGAGLLPSYVFDGNESDQTFLRGFKWFDFVEGGEKENVQNV